MEIDMAYSIAIDGPAGAGKSTIAKQIAKELSFIYVDTGAMYRAMALFLIRKGIHEEEQEKISNCCKEADISIIYKDGEQQVILNGENVTAFIRTEEVGIMASHSSANREVRLKLVELQRELAKVSNVVMDGRDIGTYVLPEADVKIYLTATAGTRALRRYRELQAKGISGKLEKIEQDIIERDERDMSREFAPLKQAEDAVLVDSSEMSIGQVVQKIIAVFHETCRNDGGNIGHGSKKS